MKKSELKNVKQGQKVYCLVSKEKDFGDIYVPIFKVVRCEVKNGKPRFDYLDVYLRGEWECFHYTMIFTDIDEAQRELENRNRKCIDNLGNAISNLQAAFDKARDKWKKDFLKRKGKK